MFVFPLQADDEKPLGEIQLRWCKVDIVDASQDKSGEYQHNEYLLHIIEVHLQKKENYLGLNKENLLEQGLNLHGTS